jgi:hypothetical protein
MTDNREKPGRTNWVMHANKLAVNPGPTPRAGYKSTRSIEK